MREGSEENGESLPAKFATFLNTDIFLVFLGVNINLHVIHVIEHTILSFYNPAGEHVISRLSYLALNSAI